MPKNLSRIISIAASTLLVAAWAGCGAPADTPGPKAKVVDGQRLVAPRRLATPTNARPLSSAAPNAVASHAPRDEAESVQRTDAEVLPPELPASRLFPTTERATDTKFAAPRDFQAIPKAKPQEIATPVEPDPPVQGHANADAQHGSVVPWATPVTRPDRLAGAVRQADLRTRKGVALAQRGLRLSARAEFIQAMRLIADAMDAARNCHVYRQSLARGLTALEESRDLVESGSRIEANRTLAETIAGHETRIVIEPDADAFTFADARRAYLDYAQEQLAAAVSGEPTGSMALYGLGRAEESDTDAGIAMTLYIAALAVDSRNFLASNELGVHFARVGDYPAARRHLIASWEDGRQAMTLRNLVTVHKKLGENQLATDAARLFASMSKTSTTMGATKPSVRWTDPATFARTSETASPVTRPSVATTTPNANANRPATPPTTSWLPWKPKNHR